MFVSNPSNPSIPSISSERLGFRCRRVASHRSFTALGAPDGDYSRVCWLPVLGPSAWVLWGTVAPKLEANATAVYDIDELTDAVGLGRPQRLVKAVKRLERFGIAANPANGLDDLWGLSTTTPPLTLSLHSTISSTARRFHHQAIAALDDSEQHDLYENYTPTYTGHLGGHPTRRRTP